MKAKYDDIRVQLTGTDGNAFAVIGRVNKALIRAGILVAERDQFVREAMSGDYDHLLQTCMKWVQVGKREEQDGTARAFDSS